MSIIGESIDLLALHQTCPSLLSLIDISETYLSELLKSENPENPDINIRQTLKSVFDISNTRHESLLSSLAFCSAQMYCSAKEMLCIDATVRAKTDERLNTYRR